MLPGMELMGCTDLAVPAEVMRHVVRVESSFNPYAIGVVGGRLLRQPSSLPEAVSTARMLERKGYNFSLGLAQVNRYNLSAQGLGNYETAFDACRNLQAGSRILADCYHRSGSDWGKAFSCYYSGNFVTGFRHGYVQKVLASWDGEVGSLPAMTGRIVERRAAVAIDDTNASDLSSIVLQRIAEAGSGPSRDLRPVPGSGARAPSNAPADIAPMGRTRQWRADEQSRIANSPVVVQPINKDTGRQGQGEAPPAPATREVSPRGDDAFVF